MSNEVVNRRLNIYIDEVSAGKSVDKLKAKIESLEKAIDRGKKAGKDMNNAIAELGTKKNQLDQLQQVLDGKLSPSFSQVKQRVQQLRKELNDMSDDAPGYAAKFAEFEKVSGHFDKMKASLGGMRNAIRSTFQEIKTIALGTFVGNAIQNVMTSIAGYISGMVTGTAKLSDQLADIEKTTGLSANSVRELNGELSKIDTRTSNGELRKLATEAGKLGKSAKEDVRAFVEEADKINVALGEDLGEGAITQLGKLSNIFKTNMINIASAINDIGAASEASESYQVDFLSRTAGVAPTAKLAADELLGYGAALESLGQSQEVSATALNTFFLEFIKDTEKFGKTAGFARGELTKLLEAKGTNAAFLEFLTRLKEGSKSSQDLINKLQALGIDGARGANIFLTLANNIQRVKDQQQIANAAIQSGSSVINEFNKRNNNFAASLEKLGKNISSYFANSTLSDFFQSATEGLNKYFEETKTAVEVFRTQKTEFDSLKATMVPLIERYEVLSKKAKSLGGESKLSKEEQVELNKAITTISQTIPGAITQFDEYGRAISISTEAAREYINLQQAILKEKNRDAIKETEGIVKQLESKVANIKANIKRQSPGGDAFNRALATRNEFDIDANGNALTDEQHRRRVLASQNAYVLQLGQYLAQQEERLKGQKGILDELTGGNKNLKTAIDETTKATGDNNQVVGGAIALTEEQKKKLQDLREELEKLAREYNLDELSAYQRKLAEINAKFDELVKKSQGSQNLIDQANGLRQRALEKAQSDFLQKAVKIPVVLDDDKLDKEITKISSKIAAIGDQHIKIFLELDKSGQLRAEMAQLDKVGKLRATIINSQGATQLAAKKALLEEERKAAIEASKKTGGEIDAINAEFNARGEELTKEHWTKIVGYALDIVGSIASAFSAIDQLMTQNENAKLAEEQKYFEQRRQNYKNLLDQKVIDQKTYDKKIAALDKEERKKRNAVLRQQFERSKDLQTVQASMNVIEGVTKALSAAPPPYNAILAAITAAAGAIQITAIRQQKYVDQYGDGGMMRGPSHQHRSKGMPVINPVTNQTQAYLEGGEGIANKRTMADKRTYTVTGTPSQAISALNALHGGVNWESGAMLTPKFKETPVRSINVRRVASSMQRQYATGGMFDSGSVSGAGSAQAQATADPEMKILLGLLYDRLSKPSYAYVLYGEYEFAKNRLDSIRDGGTVA